MVGVGAGCGVAAATAVTGGVAIAVVAACMIISAVISGYITSASATTEVETAAALLGAAVEKHKQVRDMGGECLGNEDDEIREWWCNAASEELHNLYTRAQELERSGYRGCCGFCGSSCCRYKVPEELLDTVRTKLDNLKIKSRSELIGPDDVDLQAYNQAADTVEKYYQSMIFTVMRCEAFKKQMALSFKMLLAFAAIILALLIFKHYYW